MKLRRLSAALCAIVCARASFSGETIYACDLLANTNALAHRTNITHLRILHCFFPILSGLGELLPPNLKVLALDLSLAESFPPTEDQKSAIVPCTTQQNLTYLKIMRSPCSLASFEWIKLLFPAITTLEIAFLDDFLGDTICRAPPTQLESTALRQITALQLTWHFPLENLRIFNALKLFPSATAITLNILHYAPPSFFEALDTTLALPSVESLSLWCPCTPAALLCRKLPTMFPSLKRMHIPQMADSFFVLLNHISEIAQVPPYEYLRDLALVSQNQSIAIHGVFFVTLSHLFPSLLDLTITLNRGNVDFFISGEHSPPLKTVKRLRIRAGSINCHSFPSLARLFPNLKLLELSKCCLWNFPTASTTCFFHPYLEHLDVSYSSGLNDALFSMSSTRSMLPLGGLCLPLLRVLDARRSFTRKLPFYFFNGCPEIRTLLISFYPDHTTETSDQWSFLRPLFHLEALHVEIVQCPSDTHSETFGPIVNSLAKTLTRVKRSLKLRTVIRLFAEGTGSGAAP